MFRDLYREGYERDPEGFVRRSMELSDEMTRQQVKQQQDQSRVQLKLGRVFRGKPRNGGW